MTVVFDPALIIFTFLWIGFVCAISFMEAGLKFRAPGVTLQLGLSIGRLVFGALNKVEWVLALGIIVNHILFHHSDLDWTASWAGIAIIILAIQTAWMLPVLNRQAMKIISGGHPLPSSFHKYYLLLELVKVVALFIYGLYLFG